MYDRKTKSNRSNSSRGAANSVTGRNISPGNGSGFTNNRPVTQLQGGGKQSKHNRKNKALAKHLGFHTSEFPESVTAREISKAYELRYYDPSWEIPPTLPEVAKEETFKGPGILNGGSGTTRLNLDAFWDIWQSSQRDSNIHELAVETYIAAFSKNTDAPAPFFETSYLLEDYESPDGLTFCIRTGDGRHRITAAHRLGMTHIYVVAPSVEIQSMAEIVGLKEPLFPDL